MRCRLLAIGALLAFSMSVFAWDYSSTGSTTEQTVQMRIGAGISKKWRNGLKLSFSEELRFNLLDELSGKTAKSVAVDTTLGAAFNKSYTTLSLSYSPIEYFKMDGGYTLRILGNKGWTDYNKYLRHRVFFGVTGAYRMRYAKLQLRERAICDIRTDSINLLEKNQYNWSLRSRLGADFYILSQPAVKPYIWCELENTLNVPEYQQKNGRQYISRVRAQAGVRWRITKLSSLDFYYRFQYGYDRDINITKSKGNIQLTEEKSYLHAIGVVYNLDW